ncbi:MAG: ABC transporter substrate-binding protein [Propioniciclava sp.]
MRSRIITGVAAIAGAALLMAGCSSSPATPTAGTDEKITLTVATFNEFGYDNLLAEYTTLHPNITVTEKKAATSNEARENFSTKLAAGSGLSDIEAVEVDWLPEIMETADLMTDLSSSDVQGRWLDWKVKQATTTDGKLLGYGTDIGPEAVCYRADLFEKAGLPSDPDAVAKAMGSSWGDYFALGKKFVQASPGVAWYDSADATFQGMVNQVPNAFSSTEPEETIIPLAQNTAMRNMYDQVLTASNTDKLSAGLAQWSTDWQQSFQNNGFATMLCPAWMTGVIEGNAKGVTGWKIANVFPGGGGNWGGSFLTVPAQGKHVAEAKALADWLTAPEQQIKAFKAKGTFPSQVAALTNSDLLNATAPFFNDAKTGQIFADRANAVTVVPFKGRNYFAIRQSISDASNRVDVDHTADAASSWEKAAQEVAALG